MLKINACKPRNELVANVVTREVNGQVLQVETLRNHQCLRKLQLLLYFSNSLHAQLSAASF
jgi:hypothetical protein